MGGSPPIKNVQALYKKCTVQPRPTIYTAQRYADRPPKIGGLKSAPYLEEIGPIFWLKIEELWTTSYTPQNNFKWFDIGFYISLGMKKLISMIFEFFDPQPLLKSIPLIWKIRPPNLAP